MTGAIWMPLCANAGSYWNSATSLPSARATAPMVLPQRTTSATVLTAYFPISMAWLIGLIPFCVKTYAWAPGPSSSRAASDRVGFQDSRHREPGANQVPEVSGESSRAGLACLPPCVPPFACPRRPGVPGLPERALTGFAFEPDRSRFVRATRFPIGEDQFGQKSS